VDASGPREKGGPDILIVLGISAIDVLCCALVCSLVLFLMLSQARSTQGATRGKGTNRDLMISFSVPVSPNTPPEDWPVIRVRVFEPTPARPDSVAGTALLFWGDQRESITDARPLLVFPDHGEIVWTSDDLPEAHERLSVLQLHNPRPGYARIELAYVDSKSGLVGPLDATMHVKVSVAGAVTARFTVDLALDSKGCVLGAESCSVSNVNGAILNSLQVLPQ
jgi:hypothetical protein